MLAILSTHPIQYQAPLWQALARDGSVPFEVWYLTDHGVKPTYDTQFEKSFAWDLDTLSGYQYRFLTANSNPDVARFNRVRLSGSLRPLIREKQVRALWVQGWQVRAYWQAVWEAHSCGVPVWLRGESNDLAPVSRWKKPIKRTALHEFFRRVREFLYIGQANRRLYESFGVAADRLHPAPYCVDNGRFERQAEALSSEREAIRRQWNIPSDSLCVLFAGKFIAKKHPFDLIAAAGDARLRANGLPVHLLFAGSGALGEQMRKACHVVFDAETPDSIRPGSNGNGHSPRASFTGFLNQTEISKAFVAADCLVLPSDHGETWGLIVNEAMASGLPCIASDACGCAEDLIAPLDEAFRFRLGDAGSLSSALIAVLNRPVSKEKLRAQVDKFGIATSVETVRRLYRSIEMQRGS